MSIGKAYGGCENWRKVRHTSVICMIRESCIFCTKSKHLADACNSYLASTLHRKSLHHSHAWNFRTRNLFLLFHQFSYAPMRPENGINENLRGKISTEPLGIGSKITIARSHCAKRAQNILLWYLRERRFGALTSTWCYFMSARQKHPRRTKIENKIHPDGPELLRVRAHVRSWTLVCLAHMWKHPAIG